MSSTDNAGAPPFVFGYPGQAQYCPFINMLCLINCLCTCAYMYLLFVFVCTPVHVYDPSDRCWIAIVMDFNAYLTELPTDRWHGLLEGHNCKVRRPGISGSVTEAQSYEEGRSGRSV